MSKPRLAAALATAGAWALAPRPGGQPRVLRRLPGGVSNDSWLLAWGEHRLVLRLDGVDAAAPGLDRSEEVVGQAAAAAAGLAPRPRYRGPGFLVSDYLVSDDRDSNGPDPGDPVARSGLLRRIHGLAVNARRLDLDNYLSACEAAAGARVPADLPALARRCCAALGRTGEAPVLCHNDLTAANCLGHGGRLVALDWEYAARGDRWLDLARCAGDDPAAHQAYLGRPPTAAEDRALAAGRALLPYLDSLWYALHDRADAPAWNIARRALGGNDPGGSQGEDNHPRSSHLGDSTLAGSRREGSPREGSRRQNSHG